jgi:general L-amino acid transport system permease protein
VTQTSTEPPPAPDTVAGEPTVVWYRNVRILRIVGQLVAVGVVVGILGWLFNNLITNLARQNINTDFGFLNRPTNFQISFDQGFDPRRSVWQMIFVGVRNTFLAGIVGIIIASIVGLIVGISRLSSNWLVSKIATVYVEVFRNIPPLVIIIFFGFAVFTFGPFPLLSEATQIHWLGGDNTFLVLSNTVWGIPSLNAEDNVGIFWITFIVAVVAAVAVGWWRTRLSDRTGVHHHRILWGFGTFLVIAVFGHFIAGGAFSMSWPVVSDNGRRIDGGFIMNFGFIATALALGLYTASHIAEIIRGSILAVPKGQSEAANAIALSAFQRYRYVILPQSMRIALPPTINQFLNLVKNTSLGIAVSYAEITLLTKTSIGNGRPAPQSIAILMGVYLIFSLTISFFLNAYNRRLQLAER